MNKEQMTEYKKLETIQERASFLLGIGVSAKVNIVDLDLVYQAFVCETSLPVTAENEAEAIEKGTAWLKEIRERHERDKYASTLKDAFGRERQLQLGIPSGENGHRLLDVSPVLAESVIRAHIENKRAQLVEANERARIELGA